MAVTTELTKFYKSECVKWNGGKGGVATPVYIAFRTTEDINGVWKAIPANLIAYKDVGNEYWAKWRAIVTNDGETNWHVERIMLIGITSQRNPGSQSEIEFQLNALEDPWNNEKTVLVRTQLTDDDIVTVPPETAWTITYKLDYNPS